MPEIPLISRVTRVERLVKHPLPPAMVENKGSFLSERKEMDGNESFISSIEPSIGQWVMDSEVRLAKALLPKKMVLSAGWWVRERERSFPKQSALKWINSSVMQFSMAMVELI